MSVAPGVFRKKIRVTVVAADGLSKRDFFGLPDPFAVIDVDAEQTHTTSVIKKTLNPYWNESFNLTVTDSSVVAVQIFDQRKFKRPGQGFLGVVNVRVSDVLDLGLNCHEMLTLDLKKSNDNLVVHGKLIIYLSTEVNQPINNPGPSKASGLNTAMANMGLNTSPTASTSNLAIAASTAPLTRTPSSHDTDSDTTAQAVPSVTSPGTASPESATASAATAAAAVPPQSPSDSRPTNTVGTSPATVAQSLSSELPMNKQPYRRELKNEVVVQAPNDGSGVLRKKIRVTIVAADGLSKRGVFPLPDPFAVIDVDAEQMHTTSVMKSTLNPYWNESFDITVKDSSVVAVQIFDQRKFKRPDQGFLGVVNVRVSDVLDLGLDCHEMVTLDFKKSNHNLVVRGKLFIYLSTDVNQPINNPGPSQVSGLNTAMANIGLNTSPTASTSNLAIAASTAPLTRSHATQLNTTAQTMPSVTSLVAASSESGTASAAIAAAAAAPSEFVPMNKQPYRRELKNEVVVQAPNDGFQPSESLELWHINEFEFTPPRTDPAFVSAPHSSARILVYQSLFSFLEFTSSSINPRLTLTIHDYYESMSAEDSISALVKSRESRTTLLKLSSDLGIADDPKLRDALREDEGRIETHILSILDSESSKETVLKLVGDPAQYFLDVVQNVLDRGLLLERDHSARARRIILKLSEACDKLPSSLFITGVTRRDEHATFGGGFGDIYRATYAGKTVALKHVRTFHRDADLRRIRLQFCREALVWQHLRHPHILPLIGIDRDSFPPSLCMVSPWMEHGTVLKYLNNHGRANVDRLLSEIAQGLEYLHSRKIVHGDLRGANILINDKWSACLADFGLTSLSDATTATHTSNRAGSIRWMAPELIAPDRFGHERFTRTPASDVYAFGCVCLELYTGRHPFADIPEHTAMFRVIDGERPPKPSCDPPISEALWQYMTEYWTGNSAMRPATDVIVQHMGLNYVSWLVTQFSMSPSTSGSADQEEMEMRSSIQRRMTQALEIAREAVILDTTNEDPAATIQKYRASVALLSQLLFQMHSEGETVSSPRGQRNRVQEEEIRRIQNIHDTYSDRMNVLSIIYNIPVMTEAEYSAMQAENQEDIPRVF